MTFEEEQQLERLEFNQVESHGWKSSDDNWTICAYNWEGERLFAIHRKQNPRPKSTDARWAVVQSRIDTLETAAAIANELARAEAAALREATA